MEKIIENEIINQIKNRFENVAAETPEIYRTKNNKRNGKRIDCFLLKELIPAEVMAIGNYQDIYPWNEQKLDWSFEIPKHWKSKAYCFAINSCCRFAEFYSALMKEEKEIIDFNLQHLDSAIEKGRISGNPFIYRGVFEVNWLPKNHGIGTEYVDNAFGSFSLKLETALQYTNPENPIIFRLEVTADMEAL
ncbi:MAG: hypothetical protein LBE57_01480 [Methanosarcinales archaeon]|nr:hypothetical protein [Methanosarcinales archaeon]